MTSGPDRYALIAQSTTVTGLDFIYVHADQVTLDVRFLSDPSALDTPLVDDLNTGQVAILPVEEGDPQVEITGISWTNSAAGDNVLRVVVASPGGFSPYRLSINDPRVDPYFSSLKFTFKANCPSDVDCDICPPECPPDDVTDFPVDYRARDFWSFRTALLDFATQRYPNWGEAKDRHAADVGVMLAEVMSALGDDLAYYQDRVAREAYLETATQRRSVRRHAELVDYELHDGRGASGWLDVQVGAGQGTLPAGTSVWSVAPDGTKIYFSVGTGLEDATNYVVSVARNALPAHIWHETDLCLPFGSTHVDIEGAHATDLQFNDPPADPSGRWVLLRTDPRDPSIPTRRQLVRVTSIEEIQDPLLGVTVTRLTWSLDQATAHDMQLATLTVHGNMVPVTAGRTITQRFTIGPSDHPDDRPSAVEREGRVLSNASAGCTCVEDSCDCGPISRVPTYLRSLPATDTEGLVWLGPDLETLQPQISVNRVEPAGAGWNNVQPWDFRRSFIGVNSSEPLDFHFTLEDGFWTRVVGYQRTNGEIVHQDYVGGDGKTVRFGDGEFGRIPEVGNIFQVEYRVGNGPVGNLPADAISNIESGFPFVASVSNPLPTTGGVAAQSLDEARQLAPEAFRAVTYRAVTKADYAEAVERLDWVQRAGASFRWTGSWLTAFVAPDPRHAFTLSAAHAQSAREQLDRFRQAGRDTAVLGPRYVDIDLKITVCAVSHAFRDEVAAMVMETLFGTTGFRPKPGFFSPDNFTFGTPLERSALEAAIQATSGVEAVKSISIRRRGWFDWRDLTELTFEVASNEVIRLENDPDHPDRGTLNLYMEGGA